VVVVVWSLSTIIVPSIIDPLSCGWSFDYSRERERERENQHDWQ
jgi:hypothetical protein